VTLTVFRRTYREARIVAHIALQEHERNTDAFTQYRSLLFAIAYRMTGSVMDAEDLVQEAWLRWRGTDRAAVAAPRAYLAAVVTRLSIDHLRAARVRRERYIGPWLPEPLLTGGDMADRADLDGSLSLTFLVLLEDLTPVERAVFLLHDVFAYPFEEIAPIVGKGAANTRQIAARARRHIAARRPRFTPEARAGERLVREFLRVVVTGDMHALVALLKEDITVWSDGGGVVSAARRPILGATNVARFFVGIARKATPTHVAHVAHVNGQPAIVVTDAGRDAAVFAFDVAGGRIAAIRVVVNPDKLRGLRHAVTDDPVYVSHP